MNPTQLSVGENGPVLFTSIDVKDDVLRMTAASVSALLNELQRFVEYGKRKGDVVSMSPYENSISLKRNGEQWIMAIHDHKTDQWTLRIPIQSILDCRTPERYIFMTPREWREQNSERIRAASEVGPRPKPQIVNAAPYFGLSQVKDDGTLGEHTPLATWDEEQKRLVPTEAGKEFFKAPDGKP
jgi:hypothetical protein